MPRNETQPVGPAQLQSNLTRRETFLTAQSLNRAVTVDYTKRDGTRTTRTGTVVSVGGSMTHTNAHVILDTDAGPRTFNLHLIANVRDAG